MAHVIIFDPPERFVSGTVGQPGERTFFIQARSGARLISVSLEKTQLAALVERLAYILREVRTSNPMISITPFAKDDLPLETPIEEEFRVGMIEISFLADRELISIQLQDIDDQELASADGEYRSGELPLERDTLEAILSPAMVSQFNKRSLALIGAGRAPCPFCAAPINPGGHICPRANGYRR